jgi:glycosyltransferase involved in cell wall biosynthesis
MVMALDAVRAARPHAVLGVVPSLSSGMVARTAAMRFGVPYGIVLQDLVGQAAVQSRMTAAGGVARIIRSLEAWAVRGAGAVGIIAEGFRPYVESFGIEPSRVRRLRNWTHVAPLVVERQEMRARLDWPAEATVCLHAGNMGAKQGLENVVEAARLADGSRRELLFVLMGDGSQRPMIERMAARYSLDNLRILPLQPKDELSSILSAADVLLVNQLGSVADMSLPSKLTAYYAAGRPVVVAAAAGSETAREATASGGALLVPPDSPAELLAGVTRVADDTGLAALITSSAREWCDRVLAKAPALRAYEQFVAALMASGRGRVHLAPATSTLARMDAHDGGEGSRERWAA